MRACGRWPIILLLFSVLAGCASAQQTRIREAIRKAAVRPVAEAPGEVATVFRELAQAGGLDSRHVYVAVLRSDALNAGALGDHHFFVTSGAIALGDRSFLTGLAAHELAHDLLRHPEWAATTSDVTSALATVLGAAAGGVAPGAGYLVRGVAGLGLKAYSRRQESDADALAVKLLRDAGKPEWLLRYTLACPAEPRGMQGARTLAQLRSARCWRTRRSCSRRLAASSASG